MSDDTVQYAIRHQQLVARFSKFKPHPLVVFSNPIGGANGMRNGDIVRYFNERPVRLDEALHDGDALVTLADGSHSILKWAHLRPWQQ